MPGSGSFTTSPSPPLVHAAVAHAHFEAIHPFLDGNGRVGGLLITLLLIARGVLPSPLLCLSAYFESTRDAYYAHLLALTERGEWEEWLTYFLRGVVLQSEDALERIERLDDLLAGWRRGLAAARSRLPEQALDLFAENPFWTVRGVSSRLGGGLHDRSAGHRAPAGVRHRHPRGRRSPQPRLLCGGRPEHPGAALPSSERCSGRDVLTTPRGSRCEDSRFSARLRIVTDRGPPRLHPQAASMTGGVHRLRMSCLGGRMRGCSTRSGRRPAGRSGTD